MSRGPYVSATQQDAQTIRAWCVEHYPEMLEL